MLVEVFTLYQLGKLEGTHELLKPSTKVVSSYSRGGEGREGGRLEWEGKVCIVSFVFISYLAFYSGLRFVKAQRLQRSTKTS